MMCAVSSSCMDNDFNEVICSTDADCNRCISPQPGGPDCSGSICPGDCSGYSNGPDCNASAYGCTWDTSLTVYDSPCCVAGGAPAPELPSRYFWWIVCALIAIASFFGMKRRSSAR